MTCSDCKHYLAKPGYVPVCRLYRKDRTVRCIDFKRRRGASK